MVHNVPGPVFSTVVVGNGFLHMLLGTKPDQPAPPLEAATILGVAVAENGITPRKTTADSRIRDGS
jgi:hypothetical protein